MPAVATTSPLRTLFSKDGKILHDGIPLDWRELARERGVVVKIVVGVGRLPWEEYSIIRLSDPFPEDFTELFPSLTHLHLWNIDGLEGLPGLPAGLKCLDLRACRDLVSLPELPSGLDTLVIEQCPALLLDADANRFANVEELSLKECPAIPATWIYAVLAGARALKKLDVSYWTQLSRIFEWPSNLVDIRLNGCTKLKQLPDYWPLRLRRLELRRATRIEQLEDFDEVHEDLDYLGFDL
jgi:hypothetical protein